MKSKEVISEIARYVLLGAIVGGICGILGVALWITIVSIVVCTSILLAFE